MPTTNVHIINHTHWDREWFLTSVYTRRWIPGLIDKLEQLAAANPDFRFLLDGQTLVIEDLLEIAPNYAERVGRLVRNGRLLIGPYYCQPDWQLTSGELLIRNLMVGQQDVQQHGGQMNTGWLVDTFGHISQAPQIHRLFGIESVFVWRGVPELEPYFHWQAPDGSQLLTINLFGGYRNLYGVSHVPEVAVKRLNAEVAKLRPFYPTRDIPLFDGYDLEDNPEDPFRFYAQQNGIEANIALQESTPAAFAQILRQKQLPLPTLSGELNSGKFGATFPGAFSARTYLKIMARDCEQMLFQVCEPLATMARLQGRPYHAAQYESWSRLLLQNAVHDCICGVSIDQVHEKMEYSYRQAFTGMAADAQASLNAIMAPFAAGDYVVSANPFVTDSWQEVEDKLIHARTNGVGVWPVVERVPIERVKQPVDSFHWQNEHYEAALRQDGVVRVNDAVLGQLVVAAEHGDTYSDEKGEQLGVIRPASPLMITEKSARHAVVRFSGAWRGANAQVSVTVRLHFDQSPLLKWQIDLDSRGTDLRIEMVFATAMRGNVVAGLPFDAVQRPVVDTDLMPRQLPDNLAGVLLGQRELNAVSTFPMHDFVAVANDSAMIAVLSKGIRAYSAAELGTIRLPLRRSVEWLTKADLPNRVGDAGPFFYVPDARCERIVRHEVAAVVGLNSIEPEAFQSLLAAYQNPPLIVKHEGDGAQTRWQVLQESLPLSSLQVVDGAVLARFYNPVGGERPFSRPYTKTNVWGEPEGRTTSIAAKQIMTVQLSEALPPEKTCTHQTQLMTPHQWRVDDNAGAPDPKVMQQLETKIQALLSQLAETKAQIASATGSERLRLQQRYYMLKREQLEFQLSHLLNKRKLAQEGSLHFAYLYQLDEEIAAIGLELNHSRIKRRIFDYVVQAL